MIDAADTAAIAQICLCTWRRSQAVDTVAKNVFDLYSNQSQCAHCAAPLEANKEPVERAISPPITVRCPDCRNARYCSDDHQLKHLDHAAKCPRPGGDCALYGGVLECFGEVCLDVLVSPCFAVSLLLWRRGQAKAAFDAASHCELRTKARAGLCCVFMADG